MPLVKPQKSQFSVLQAQEATKPRPGRPPSEKSRRAILDMANRVLMEEGLGRFSIERVASLAGVGKPTIYRYWKNAHDLAMAALMETPDAIEVALPVRSAKQALKRHLVHVVQAFATPRGRQITLTMASADQSSEIAKAFRNQIILKNREVGREILVQAKHAKEISLGADVETVLDMIYGPLFFRLLAGHQTLNAEFANQVVDRIFEGLRRIPPS